MFLYVSTKLCNNGSLYMLQNYNNFQSKGLDAEMVPSAELSARVNYYVEKGAVFMHPFDDERLFHGYGTLVLSPSTTVYHPYPPDGGYISKFSISVQSFIGDF